MKSALPIQHGDGARMEMLSDGEADLVFCSPPYWPPEADLALHARRSEQTDISDMETLILSTARKQRPVFQEIARVLRHGRALILQTKDIRYGEFLVPLSDTHVSVAASCGLHLITRLIWIPERSASWRTPGFAKRPAIGGFKAADGESFIVMAHADGLDPGPSIDLGQAEARALVSPLWRMNARPRKDDHPQATPRAVVRRLIQLFSEPGDLVVDPFAGRGTILEIALSLGRRAIGWEIDRKHIIAVNGGAP